MIDSKTNKSCMAERKIYIKIRKKKTRIKTANMSETNMLDVIIEHINIYVYLALFFLFIHLV